MKIKLLQIFANWPILEKIATFEIDAPSAIRYQRFLQAAQVEYQLIEQQRVRLVQKHGKEVDGDLKVDKSNPAEFAAFWDEFNKVLAQEIEIVDPELSSRIFEGQRISAVDFFAVAWLFDRDKSQAGLLEPAEDPDNGTMG